MTIWFSLIAVCCFSALLYVIAMFFFFLSENWGSELLLKLTFTVFKFMNTAIKNVPNTSLLLKTELITRHYFRVRLSCSVMLPGSHRVGHEALFWEGVSSIIIPAQGRSILVRGGACYAFALNWLGSEKANIKTLDGRRREWRRGMNRKWLNREWRWWMNERGDV